MTTPTATWNGARDWAAGETLTEPSFDNYLSSNLLALKTPPQARTTAGTTTSTTSAVLVDIALVTHTITTTAAAAEVMFTGIIGVTVACSMITTLLIDGANVGNATWGIATVVRAAASTDTLSYVFRSAVLTAGSHTFKMQWLVTAGTATLQPGWNFYVVER